MYPYGKQIRGVEPHLQPGKRLWATVRQLELLAERAKNWNLRHAQGPVLSQD